jgi:small subunit ribosomal protein S17
VGERQSSGRKQLIGDVVSDKMDKTVVVRVERLTRHPRYGKVLRRTKKYKAHDEENTCRVGDRVCIVESRPLSREKRWVVVEIVERVGAETGVGVS